MTPWVLDHCFLVIRDQNADQSPVLPGSWTALRVSNGWYILRRNSDNVRVAAWRANTDATGTQALYAVFGALAVLNTIPNAMPANVVWTAAQGGNALAIAVMRRWPTWQWSGSEREPVNSTLVAVNNVVRRLIFEGQTLPTPATAFPWRFSSTGAIVGTDAACRYRVSGPVSSLRPALDATMAGFPLHTTLEGET